LFFTPPPAQNAPPAPVGRAQPTSRSSSAAASSSPSLSCISWVRALRCSGRLKVSTRTPFSRRTRRSLLSVIASDLFVAVSRRVSALTLGDRDPFRGHVVDFSLAIAGLDENLTGVLPQPWGELIGGRGSF